MCARCWGLGADVCTRVCADGVFVHDAGLGRHAMLLHPLSALFVCRGVPWGASHVGLYIYDCNRHVRFNSVIGTPLVVAAVSVRARLNPCAEHLVVHVCEPE